MYKLDSIIHGEFHHRLSAIKTFFSDFLEIILKILNNFYTKKFVIIFYLYFDNKVPKNLVLLFSAKVHQFQFKPIRIALGL